MVAASALPTAVIDDLLADGEVYEVGGTVRDDLLGQSRSTKDTDILVTGIPYDRLAQRLSRHGRVDLVGRSFGVIKFRYFLSATETALFDVSLPRRELSTGIGHRDFEVDFDHSLPVEDDLHRRDFTINAIARSLRTGQLVDPLDGQIDLNDRVLRMTCDTSFVDDPLRMLRGVQFAARLGFDLEAATAAAMRRHAAKIASVSAERIWEELTKLLERAEQPSIGFHLMNDTGLLEHVLPELAACVGVDQPGPYHEYDVFEHTLRVVDAAPHRLRVRLAALMHDIEKPSTRRVIDGGKRATFYGHDVIGARTARQVLDRFPVGASVIADVATLVERHMFADPMTDRGLRRLIRRVGPELIFDLLDLRRADIVGQGKGGTFDEVDELESRIRSEIKRKAPFSTHDLALSGGDLMQVFGLPQGPLIGRILEHLLEKALDHPEDNTHSRLIAHAREFLAENDAS